MISAEEFIDILERKDLLEPSLIRDLRRRVEQSMAPVSAALLAKRLVDKGHLSRKLAQRLLDRAESEEDAVVTPPVRKPVKEKPEVENLGLAPLEEDEEERAAEAVADLERTEEEDWGLLELDEDKPKAPAIPAAPVRPAVPVPADKPIQAAVPVPTAKLVQPGVPVQPAQPVRQPMPGSPAVRIPPAAPVAPAASLAGGLEEIEEIGEPLLGLDVAGLEGLPLEGPLGSSRRGRRGKRGKGVKGERRNVWDSSLLLIGGGVLLFLIIIMVVLVFVLSGRGADTMLAQADEYYSAGSYTKAADSYTQFVKRFPKHPGIGKARIRLGLAKMRQAVGSEWPHALDVARTEIPLISGEETFATDARPELASILPDIAAGLANEAHSTRDSKMADLAEEGVALVEKYIPSSARPQEQMQDIRSLIALTRREIARGERLNKTVAEMVKAAQEGRTREGYELRRDLLKEYPVLLDDPSLADAVRIVSAAEQAAVNSVDKPVNAAAGEPESKALATIGLAQRSIQSPVAGVAGQRVFAVAGGAVYGLEATDGKVLWRRDVGFEKNVRGSEFPPTPVSDRAGADPLLVSRSRQEVLRVEASTGKIRWRFPVAEAFDAHPVVSDGRVYVATLSGRLLLLDLETGNSSGYIQMPQPLRVGPVADSSRNVLYQVGEHSSLFVLSATDGTCTGVTYLGHERGSIVVPPVRVSRYLLVCENDGVRDSVVKVLDVELQNTAEGPPPTEVVAEKEPTPTEVVAKKGPAPIQVIQVTRLRGHVHTMPIVNGPQVLLVTDAGAIMVFQVTGTEGKEPLLLSAEGTTSGEDHSELVRYASMEGGQLWVADNQLTQYAVRSSESRLKPTWIANEGSVSLQPPMVAGEAVIHVRNRRRLPGVVVSAVSAREGVPLWETTLACPVAGPPVVDGTTRKLVATTTVGGVFQMEPPAEGEIAFRDDPTGTIPIAELTAPLRRVLRFPNGMIAMIPAEGAVDIPIFEPGKTADAAKIRNISLVDPLSGEAVIFCDGLLAPTAGGQVFLLDVRTGAEIAAPFQPQLEAGRKYRWSRPAVIGDDRFVIADDGGGVYCAVLRTDPAKHLAEASTIRLDDPATSPIAVLGNRVYAVDRTDSLVRLDLPELSDKTQQPLGAKCVLGPLAVGEYVVLITNDDLMHLIDSSGKMQSHKLPYGTPVGEPVVDGAHWLLAAATGVVWRVDPATGEEVAKEETGLTLGSGLAFFDSRLLASGHDGTVYLITKP